MLRNVSGKKMTVTNKTILAARYKALSFDGFSYHSSVASVKKYTGSFVGKDYKCFIQLAPFLLHGLIPETDLLVWISIAEIVCLCYITEITCLAEYLTHLNVAISNLYSLLRQYCGDLLSKPKVHMLHHAHEFIIRFGPLILVSTEKEEQKNGDVRKVLFCTNRSDPSYDTAIEFAKQEGLQTVLMPGAWIDPAFPNSMVLSKSGDLLKKTVKENPEILRMAGIDLTAVQFLEISKQSGITTLLKPANRS